MANKGLAGPFSVKRPGWSDIRGWANTLQYNGIQLGDIDGDRQAELVAFGRKGRVLTRRIYTEDRYLKKDSESPDTPRTPHDYQRKLIPLLTPPPPLPPPAPPNKTGSSLFAVSVAAHAPSNNDAARTKTAAGEAGKAYRRVGVSAYRRLQSVINFIEDSSSP